MSLLSTSSAVQVQMSPSSGGALAVSSCACFSLDEGPDLVALDPLSPYVSDVEVVGILKEFFPGVGQVFVDLPLNFLVRHFF